MSRRSTSSLAMRESQPVENVIAFAREWAKAGGDQDHHGHRLRGSARSWRCNGWMPSGLRTGEEEAQRPLLEQARTWSVTRSTPGSFGSVQFRRSRPARPAGRTRTTLRSSFSALAGPAVFADLSGEHRRTTAAGFAGARGGRAVGVHRRRGSSRSQRSPSPSWIPATGRWRSTPRPESPLISAPG